MNKHDQMRKNALVKTLVKAAEQAATFRLYITGNNTEDMDELARADIAEEHIRIALAHLSKEHDGLQCRECGCTEHHACEDGCYWVEPDLCSSCADKKGGEWIVDATGVV